MSETRIEKEDFAKMGIKGQLSVLYDNTEATRAMVECMAKQKISTIIKWSAITAIGVYVIFQVIPIDAALPIIKVILGG